MFNSNISKSSNISFTLFLIDTFVVKLIYLDSIKLARKTAIPNPKLLNKSAQSGLFQLIIKNGIVVKIIKIYFVKLQKKDLTLPQIKHKNL